MNSSNNHVIVIALLKAKPGKEEVLENVLKQQIRKIRTEPGYVKFDLHRSNEANDSFMLYEIWSSENALKLHFEQDHTKVLVTLFNDILAEPIKVWHLSKVLV